MKCLEDIFDKTNEKPELIHSLSLAFLGDVIHSLYMRNKLVCSKDFKQKDMQRITSQVVCAKNQAKTFDFIFSDLQSNEMDVALRARNAKTNNIAKNSSIEEYKKSTAFEALLGYEYLKGEIDRLSYFLNVTLQVANIEKEII